MKKMFSLMLFFAMIGCINSVVFATELLDVKPLLAGSTVSIEITADIPMTYTYYKVPGQARAVVDIAEVDPEKVEPLIVVNKGAVSSISVDKVQISGLIASRIIFNLAAESDISVAASLDRKKLTVTFAGSAAVGGKPEPEPEPEPLQQAEPAVKAAVPATAATPGNDPLGLDEQPAALVVPAAKTEGKAAPVAPPVAPMVTRIGKLEPVVPVTVTPVRRTALSVKEIVAGASYIDIRTTQPVTDYKSFIIKTPERLVIDIHSEMVSQKPKTFTIKKFGISKARIGVSPQHIRIVIDSGKAEFPGYTISSLETGLRIRFK